MKKRYIVIGFIICLGILISLLLLTIQKRSKNAILGLDTYPVDTKQEVIVEDVSSVDEVAVLPGENEVSEIIEDNSKVNTEVDESTQVDEVNISIEESYDGVIIKNADVIIPLLESEEGEILLYDALENQFKKEVDKTLIVDENSIYKVGNDIEFLVYTSSRAYYKVILNPFLQVINIKDYSYKKRTVDQDVYNKINELQEQYPESLNKQIVYTETDYDKILDITVDFYLSVALEEYEEAYNLLAHDKMCNYIKEYHYEYYDFKSDMKSLREKCGNLIFDISIEDYISYEDYYLVKLGIYAKGEKITEKWDTVFYTTDGELSLFIEDINLLELWRNNYK